MTCKKVIGNIGFPQAPGKRLLPPGERATDLPYIIFQKPQKRSGESQQSIDSQDSEIDYGRGKRFGCLTSDKSGHMGVLS